MRRLAIIGTCGGVLVMSASTTAAYAKHKMSSQCSAAHSLPVVADSEAQVYLADEFPGDPEFLAFYGCAYGHRRVYKFGPTSSSGGSSGAGGGVRRVALAGVTVAYEEWSTVPHGPTYWFIIVRNLRTGRVLHKVPTGIAGPETVEVVGAGFSTAIVVKSDGAVAWIVETGTPPFEYQVHAVDRTGERVLASGIKGTNAAPESLALAGSMLYWTEGGKPFSATLN